MTITLTDREISVILKGLSKLPHEESHALIHKIVSQQADQKIKM